MKSAPEANTLALNRRNDRKSFLSGTPFDSSRLPCNRREGKNPARFAAPQMWRPPLAPGMRAAVNFGSAPKAGFEGGGASWNNSESAALSLRRVPTREVSPKTHPKARKYSSKVAGGQQQEMAQGFPRQLCPDYRRVDLGTELGGMLFRAPDGRRTRLLKRRFFRAVKSGPGIYRQGFSGLQARSGQRFCRGHQPGELH